MDISGTVILLHVTIHISMPTSSIHQGHFKLHVHKLFHASTVYCRHQERCLCHILCVLLMSLKQPIWNSAAAGKMLPQGTLMITLESAFHLGSKALYPCLCNYTLKRAEYKIQAAEWEDQCVACYQQKDIDRGKQQVFD